MRLIQLLTFHPVPTIQILIGLLPEQEHKPRPVIHQIIKALTGVSPVETQQVQAQPIREELVGRQVLKSPHLSQKQNHGQQRR